MRSHTKSAMGCNFDLKFEEYVTTYYDRDSNAEWRAFITDLSNQRPGEHSRLRGGRNFIETSSASTMDSPRISVSPYHANMSSPMARDIEERIA